MSELGIVLHLSSFYVRDRASYVLLTGQIIDNGDGCSGCSLW
jgi:hypothetical protein